MTATGGTVTRDPVSVLETIRRRGYHKAASATVARWQSDRAAEDIPRLLAGYDALLKLAGEFEAKSAALWEQINATPEAETTGPALRACAASAYKNAATGIREAIAAALSGEETPDGS